MIRTGTGIAPFKGFIQERARFLGLSNKTAGKMLWFFGCRHQTIATSPLWRASDLIKVNLS
jgi:sulfite reductase alpha subunit-like flavoprotein